jgi:hypothetical protein
VTSSFTPAQRQQFTRFLSPTFYRLEHIGLTGDHLWRPEEVPLPGTFRKHNR